MLLADNNKVTIGPGAKFAHAANPAKTVQIAAIGKLIDRQRSVLTGWINFIGKNIAAAQAMTITKMIQKLGSVANITKMTMFQHPGKPAKLLSFVFMRVSAK